MTSLTAGTWTPSADYLDRSRLVQFCAAVGVSGRAGLDAYSREHAVDFWNRVQSWLGLRWQTHPRAICDQLHDPARTRWFVDGELNIYDCAVTRWVEAGRGDSVALLRDTGAATPGSLTFRELDELVGRLASGLARIGLEFGDRVGVQLPMSVEAAVTQLALAKIGAVTVPIFSGFGSRAVADRLRHSGARWLAVADSVSRRGRTLPLRGRPGLSLTTSPG
jgi:acetyl-CoA synthetase